MNSRTPGPPRLGQRPGILEILEIPDIRETKKILNSERVLCKVWNKFGALQTCSKLRSKLAPGGREFINFFEFQEIHEIQIDLNNFLEFLEFT